MDQIEYGLGWSHWESGEVEFDDHGDGIENETDELRPSSQPTAFFYRDIVACVSYLLAQPCYTPDMVYAPVQEVNSEGDRMYSEMHTADWWWETQVIL